MFEDKEIDLHLLKTALREAAARSRVLKTLLRARWERPMAEEQAGLLKIQRRTTQLCILRAAMRGRYHLQKPLRAGAWPGMPWDRAEYHAKVAARLAAEFTPALEPLQPLEQRETPKEMP